MLLTGWQPLAEWWREQHAEVPAYALEHARELRRVLDSTYQEVLRLRARVAELERGA